MLPAAPRAASGDPWSHSMRSAAVAAGLLQSTSRMSKASKKKSRTAVMPSPEMTVDRWPIVAPAILVVVTLACYLVPMTSSETSILWDAADYYQIVQNYFSQELHAGRIPFWT